jgi:hypothetical protein
MSSPYILTIKGRRIAVLVPPHELIQMDLKITVSSDRLKAREWVSDFTKFVDASRAYVNGVALLMSSRRGLSSIWRPLREVLIFYGFKPVTGTSKGLIGSSYWLMELRE